MVRPPYLGNHPLRATKADQRLFADRERESAAVRDAVEQGLNTIIVGERGSGKTSLLHHLVAQSRGEDPAGVEVVRVDAHLAPSAARLLMSVGDALEVETFPPPPPPSLLREFVSKQTAMAGKRRAAAHLPADEEDPLALLDAIRHIGGRGRVVVALDGVSTTTAFTVFGRLRDELWEQPTRWILALDQEQFAGVMRPPADVFFEKVVTLDPFDPRTTKALLVKRGLRITDGLAAELAESGGGNPRRILALARDIATMPDAADAAGRVRGERRQLETRLSVLPPAARMLHEALCALDRPVSASDGELLSRLNWTRPRAVAVLNQLEKAGLVESGFERSDENRPGRPRRMFRLAVR